MPITIGRIDFDSENLKQLGGQLRLHSSIGVNTCFNDQVLRMLLRSLLKELIRQFLHLVRLVFEQM